MSRRLSPACALAERRPCDPASKARNKYKKQELVRKFKKCFPGEAVPKDMEGLCTALRASMEGKARAGCALNIKRGCGTRVRGPNRYNRSELEKLYRKCLPRTPIPRSIDDICETLRAELGQGKLASPRVSLGRRIVRLLPGKHPQRVAVAFSIFYMFTWYHHVRIQLPLHPTDRSYSLEVSGASGRTFRLQMWRKLDWEADVVRKNQPWPYPEDDTLYQLFVYNKEALDLLKDLVKNLVLVKDAKSYVLVPERGIQFGAKDLANDQGLLSPVMQGIFDAATEDYRAVSLTYRRKEETVIAWRTAPEYNVAESVAEEVGTQLRKLGESVDACIHSLDAEDLKDLRTSRAGSTDTITVGELKTRNYRKWNTQFTLLLVAYFLPKARKETPVGAAVDAFVNRWPPTNVGLLQAVLAIVFPDVKCVAGVAAPAAAEAEEEEEEEEEAPEEEEEEEEEATTEAGKPSAGWWKLLGY